MSATRPVWRAFVAILQIAAFLAFTLPEPAHAHAGKVHEGHTVGLHAQSDPAARHEARTHLHNGASAMTVAALSADQTDDGQVHGACCLGCCSCSCHVFATGPDGTVLPDRWANAQAMPPAPDSAYATMTPEALPEPPRSFA